jgi:hypothetical protein
MDCDTSMKSAPATPLISKTLHSHQLKQLAEHNDEFSPPNNTAISELLNDNNNQPQQQQQQHSPPLPSSIQITATVSDHYGEQVSPQKIVRPSNATNGPRIVKPIRAGVVAPPRVAGGSVRPHLETNPGYDITDDFLHGVESDAFKMRVVKLDGTVSPKDHG